MDYKIKQPLTKEFIEQDIKEAYRTLILELSSAVAFILLGFVLLWFICDMGNPATYENIAFTVVVIFFTVFALGVIAYFISVIYAYFTCLSKYVVVTDHLRDISTKVRMFFRPNKVMFYTYFRFAAHGSVQIYRYKTYYPWSQYYSMDRHSLKRTSNLGDDFYLVLVSKKIVSIYNKKIFELEDIK